MRNSSPLVTAALPQPSHYRQMCVPASQTPARRVWNTASMPRPKVNWDGKCDGMHARLTARILGDFFLGGRLWCPLVVVVTT